MNVRKVILRTVLGLLILVVLLVVVGWLAIDSLAKAGIQRGAGYALDVETRVDAVNVGVLAGNVAIRDMTIANPEGFGSEHLFRMSSFDLGVDLASLMSPTVEVRRFVLDGVDLHVEQELAGSNVGKILDNLKRFDKGGEPAPSEKGGKKVKVDRIEIRNVVAHFHLLADVAQTGPLDVRVDEIVLTDVTSDDAGGVVIGELVRRLVPAILAAVLEKAEGVVPTDVLNDLGGQVTALTQALGGQAQKLTEQVHAQVSEQLEEVLDPGKQAVDDLFGVLGGEGEANAAE